MAEAKTFASLSPTLLARKGAAKPAMRSQFQPLGHFLAPEQAAEEDAPDHRHEDLGWNDMGEPHGEPGADSATIVPFAPGETAFEAAPLTTGIPEVVRTQGALASKIEAGRRAAADPVPLPTHRWSRPDKPMQRRSALADGRRAAFTLRVDGERHLKLRLACTVQGRSAQQLVTEALDRLLDGLPELEDLARRVKRR